MDDIKKFLLRIPSGIYEALEVQSVALNTSLNKLMVEKLRESLGTVPVYQKAVERTRKIAAALPNTFAGSDIPSPAQKSKGCPECGSLAGHQKWCKSR